MAKRPKLRMTNADYLAIAFSPALIMALVGSLVFFLIEVLYVGQYHARLNYVFALFVFAAVLIGRISIEMGADRAALFALPLAIAMFLVLAKFVQHASPYSHLINIALLGVVWWSAHKLTWDCTLIDDNEDASGAGLMQRIGGDSPGEQSELGSDENELLGVPGADGPKIPHTPGLWVLYFSLAALPLFGIGQKAISVNEVGRRQYAFGLLAVYVASALALLVTTSFLGLRRYLRQRRIEMPNPMAATWVVTGCALIALVMVLAAMIPRPHSEYAISQVPWLVRSRSDLASSPEGLGNDGADNADSKVRSEFDNAGDLAGDQPHHGQLASRESDPQTASQQNQPQSSSTDRAHQPASSSTQSQQVTSQGTSEPTEATGESQYASEQEATEPVRPNGASQASAPQHTSSTTEHAAVARESSTDRLPAAPPSEKHAVAANDSRVSAATNASRPPVSLPDLPAILGGLTNVVKLAFYAVLGIALATLAWRNRQEIMQAIGDWLQQVRDLMARWLRSGIVPPTSDDEAPVRLSGPQQRPFASFADPFVDGRSQAMPPEELVRYTFEAFEAWALERGCRRHREQTPLEFIRQAVPHESGLLVEAHRLARLYNEAAYGPGAVPVAAVANLAQLWRLLRQTTQTPLESAT